MPDTLPDFPVNETALGRLEHALSASVVEVLPDGTHIFSGDYTMSRLLDFYAGVDPNNVTVEYEGDPDAGLAGAGVVVSHDLHYTQKSVIEALIAEVRRLRALVPPDQRGE